MATLGGDGAKRLNVRGGADGTQCSVARDVDPGALGAGDGHEATPRLRHEVDTGPVAVRARRPVALERGGHEAGVDGLDEGVVLQAEPVHDAGGDVLDEDIGVRQELLDEPPPLLLLQTVGQKYVNSGSLIGVKSSGGTHSRRTALTKYAVRQYQVDDDAVPQAVPRQEGDADAALLRVALPVRVAAGWLGLADLGAEFAEEPPTPGTASRVPESTTVTSSRGYSAMSLPRWSVP